MAIQTSAQWAKSLWPGINKWYGDEYNQYPVEWENIFDKETSTRQYEEDVGIAGYGLLQVKPEGSPISYDSARQGFTTRYNHIVYSLGFIITREIFDDDQYDVVGKRRAQGLAFSVRQTKEVIGANVLNNAFSSSYVGGDGVELISNAHVNVSGGTWSNRPTTYADLSEASLEQAYIDIANFKDDRGLRIAVLPNKLIVPVQLTFEAERILKTAQRVGTSNNDINVLKQMGMFPGGVHVNHYLNDSGNDAWFIKTNVKNGLKYYERNGDEFGMDNDWDTENAKFKARFRCSFGWTDPRGAYGSAGA